MEFAHIELEADDGEHEDSKEEQQPNLQQRDHGLHDGLEHHLQAWSQGTAGKVRRQKRQRQRGAHNSECVCGQNRQSGDLKGSGVLRPESGENLNQGQGTSKGKKGKGGFSV